jgi:hypothetical protein
MCEGLPPVVLPDLYKLLMFLSHNLTGLRHWFKGDIYFFPFASFATFF